MAKKGHHEQREQLARANEAQRRKRPGKPPVITKREPGSSAAEKLEKPTGFSLDKLKKTKPKTAPEAFSSRSTAEDFFAEPEPTSQVKPEVADTPMKPAAEPVAAEPVAAEPAAAEPAAAESTGTELQGLEQQLKSMSRWNPARLLLSRKIKKLQAKMERAASTPVETTNVSNVRETGKSRRRWFESRPIFKKLGLAALLLGAAYFAGKDFLQQNTSGTPESPGTTDVAPTAGGDSVSLADLTLGEIKMTPAEAPTTTPEASPAQTKPEETEQSPEKNYTSAPVGKWNAKTGAGTLTFAVKSVIDDYISDNGLSLTPEKKNELTDTATALLAEKLGGDYENFQVEDSKTTYNVSEDLLNQALHITEAGNNETPTLSSADESDSGAAPLTGEATFEAALDDDIDLAGMEVSGDEAAPAPEKGTREYGDALLELITLSGKKGGKKIEKQVQIGELINKADAMQNRFDSWLDSMNKWKEYQGNPPTTSSEQEKKKQVDIIRMTLMENNELVKNPKLNHILLGALYMTELHDYTLEQALGAVLKKPDAAATLGAKLAENPILEAAGVEMAADFFALINYAADPNARYQLDESSVSMNIHL